jgi:hypothetical protein
MRETKGRYKHIARACGITGAQIAPPRAEFA